jgi:tRNA-specific 2-thiouridylase
MRQTSYIKKPGLFISTDEDELGEHKGLEFYTIGQRKGLGISASNPLYVIEKNISTNIIVLGSRDELARKEFKIAEINWISGLAPTMTVECSVQTRYRSKVTPCFVKPLPTGEIQVQLLNPIPDITPGQAAVFYDGDTCLGGGIIQI